jgi:DnaJ-class molecular chaperone
MSAPTTTCPVCHGSGFGVSDARCGFCGGKGSVTPDAAREFKRSGGRA